MATARAIAQWFTLGTVLLGCTDGHTDPVEPEVMTMVFVPQDFQSNVLATAPDSNAEWTAVLGVRWEGYLEPDRQAEADAYFGSHIYLLSLGEGHRVAGDVRPELLDVHGSPADLMSRGSGAFSFVPRSALADGWYVLMVDARGWSGPADSRFEFGSWELVPVATEGDRVGFTRVHVGTSPTWYESSVYCEDGANPGSPGPNCRVGVAWTEEVGATTGIAFEALIDGADFGCGALDIAERGAGWVCPSIPSGAAITITIGSDGPVRSLPGHESHTLIMGAEQVFTTFVDPTFGEAAVRGEL